MIFLSYAREDAPHAKRLQAELSNEGMHCVRDITLVEGDPFWRGKIRRQLDRCRVMIALDSKWAALSPWVEQERRAFAGPILTMAVNGGRDSWGIGSKANMRIVPRGSLLSELRRLLRTATTDSTSEPLRVHEMPEALVRKKRRQKIDAAKRWLNTFIAVARRRAIPETGANAGSILYALDGSHLIALTEPDKWSARRVYVAEKPITNAQYRSFLEDTGLAKPPTCQRTDYQSPQAPVTGVTWFEAVAYAAWAGASLPTEPQWNEAANGNRSDARYATSSGHINHELAFYEQTFGVGCPCPPDHYPANNAGFYGMCGNVWDWCLSPCGEHRIIKGGGFMDSAQNCRVETRYRNAPIDRDCCVGFRLAVELST